MTFPYGLLSDPRLLQQMRAMDPTSVAMPGAMTPSGAGMPAPAAKRPSLWDRIIQKTGALKEGLKDRLAPTPGGFEGLGLTEQEVEAAQPGLLNLLAFPGLGRQMYEDNLTGTVQRRQAALGLVKQQELEAARRKVGELFPPDPNAKPEDVINTMRRQFQAYASVGDHAMTQAIGEVLKSYGASDLRPPHLMEVDAGKEIQLRNPLSGELVATIPKSADPADTSKVDPVERYTNTQIEQQKNRQMQMAKAFATDKQVVDAKAVARGVTAARAMLKLDSPASDLGAIIALTKIYDPGSVAREGEVKLTRDATALPEKLRLFVSRYNLLPFVDPNNKDAGRMLTPRMKREMAELIDSLLKENNELVKPVQADYGRAVRQFNMGMPFQIDSAFVAPSPFGSLLDTPTQLPGDRPPGAPAPKNRLLNP